MPTFTDTVLQASDGKYYKWRGAQWVEVLPGDKSGKVAPFRIAFELERTAIEKGHVSSESVFDDLLSSSIRAGLVPERTKKAREWMRSKAQETRWNVYQSDVLKEQYRAIQGPQESMIGKMYFFQYDAKYAESLEYWDFFPVIFPIEKYKDGSILGINFHYLPYKQRAMLLDSLYSLKNNRKYDETTKLNLSYQVLKGAAKYKLFYPTLHRYLPAQVKSRMIECFASEWSLACFLPLESFHSIKNPGVRKEQVWRDSIMRSDNKKK